MRTGSRHRVSVLVRPGVLPIELGIVHRLFGQAVTPDGEPHYDVVTCAVEPGPVRTDADFVIEVTRGPDALDDADTVVVPASDEDYVTDGSIDPALTAALARIRPGARIASICTGSFVLAAAGLLAGRRATTHWRSAERFRALHPGVELDEDVLYTDDRDASGEVLTAAGVASGIDLCLHMIRCDHGAAVAAEVARGTVVPPHREGGQAQYLRRPVPEPAVTSTGAARAYALAHLDRPLTLRDLAAQESVSVRTLTRRFRDEMGGSPLRWLTLRRVDRARQLLEQTDRPVDRVAADAGFGTAASLRAHLRAEVGVSPAAYRRTFRAATPSGSGPVDPLTRGCGPAAPGRGSVARRARPG